MDQFIFLKPAEYLLQAGDPIIVEKGEDEHTNREINAHAGWSTNTLANTKW